MKWTQAQRKIIDARGCNLLVSAAAGSGKTAVLVERIIEMIADTENPMDIDELLVVTFTKAAAAQMKDKIMRALEKMLDDEPDNEHYIKQLNYMNQANILTIDSFCYKVVKENYHAIGIDPAIRVGETGEIQLLQDDVLQKVIEQCYENPDFVECSEAFSGDKTDDKMLEYILKIYTVSASYPRPEQWICSAKESLHVEDEDTFLKLPFVIKYFDELHQMAKGIRAKVGMALEIARSIDGPIYMEKALLSDVMLVEDLISAKTYTQFFSLSGQKFAGIGRGKKGEYDEEKAERVKEIRDEYKKQINAILSVFSMEFSEVLSQFAAQEKMLKALLDAADMFREQFLQAKTEKGILEFSDVEHFALQVLCAGYDEENNPIPSAVGKEMSMGFREILIDEYQDSNYLQEAILQCVSQIREGNYNIFMVGDVKQSIYSFRMARPDLFMDKYYSYSEDDTAVCRKLLLKNNFRSRANVLETINYIFYQIMKTEIGGIDYTKDEALVPGKDYLQIPEDTVELLLGESKDFEFIRATDSEMSPLSEENLDENLEDIGKMELEATMIAKRIQKMTGVEGGTPYQIVSEDEKTLQDVSYKDMVILLRAPSAFSQVFQEVLLNYNIPVRVQNENGYFDTVEIRMVLSMLRVIDNPFDDVEMTAVLRGYFGKCSSDELALLALSKRILEKEYSKNSMAKEEATAGKRAKRTREKIYMFQVVRFLALEENIAFMQEHIQGQKERLEVLGKKCSQVVQLVQDCVEKKAYMGIGQLLQELYYEAGFYYYVEAMPEGLLRIRNLKLLLEEAKKFEKGTFPSLFDFLQFVNKLQKKAVSLGGDPSMEVTENVVRIMSIHKSKGLEFPVVFLAGIGKNFNLMDTKTPLIIHSDYYLGAKYVDVKRRCGNDTFIRKAFASLMLTQSIAEELRLLYVGMTRAKEKLIITGVTKDIPALLKKHEMVAVHEKIGLEYSHLQGARNYLDFLVVALMRNRTFCQAMKEVPKRFDRKGEQIISAEYVLKHEIQSPEIRLRVKTYDFKKLQVMHLKSNMEEQVNKVEQLRDWYYRKNDYEGILRDRLSWNYLNEALTKQKAKLSVTEIKRIYETDTGLADMPETGPHKKEVFSLPRFIEKERKMDAAARGTWTHKAMELYENVTLTDANQIEGFLNEMWETGRLPKETKEFLTVDKFLVFSQSDLGMRMRKAAATGKLFKEKQFVVGVPAEKLLGQPVQEEHIVVQGIIDAYFIEDDEIVLVDYKTDNVREGMEQVLVERYHTQMQYYKETLEQLTKLSVKESYLYSFALGKEILMK